VNIVSGIAKKCVNRISSYSLLQNYKMREYGKRYSYKMYEEDKLFFTAEL